ncbi:hypothetical protein GCM10023310_11560 [Paenibacillus vulneris]|uniref:Succinylglutamate desuccinylase/aspartoacylase family protein n=1 Tax=Paenibacillus vulneris TaxID=1133364 RepID=A0ABW3UH81_9BACL
MRISKHVLAKNSKFETPYYIIDGELQGSTVMITAGVHGTERAGFLSAKKLLEQLRSDVIHIRRGRLIIIPVVNRIAVRRRIRGVPDLNRTFPRRYGKRRARHPLSRAVFRLAREQGPDWYVDLHEANGLFRIQPKALGQTLIVNPGSKVIPFSKRIIRRINPSIKRRSRRFSLLQRKLPGSGRSAAYRLLHAKAITVETGIRLPLEERIRYQMKIVSSIFKEAGLIKTGDES